MKEEAKQILDRVAGEGRKFVTEPEAKAVLKAYGVEVTRDVVCQSSDEAVRAAERIGYPVVVKLVSPQVVHKTELNAVKLNLRSATEVRAVYDEMMERARNSRFQVNGILVSETATGTEFIIGSLRDKQFGPLVMLGLGGIFVEIYKDVSYRLAPVEPIDVMDMISELKGKRMLEGFRGKEKVDVQALTQAVVSVSQLISDFPGIAEMDLNPIFGSSRGIKVADARIMLG
jgi:acetate---CoA ligase (ADP-forming) subunit beta